MAFVVLAGMALIVASTLVTDYLRTRGMLAVEAAVPLRVRRTQEVLPEQPPRLVTVHIRNSAESLAAYYQRLDYRLRDVRTGADVPRVYLSALPPDLADVRPVDERKRLFLRSVLPLVLRENERLRRDRERLLGLRDALEAGAEPGAEARAWLAERYEHYGVEPGELTRLLRRLDVVPPSLALAQAAMESGWGTSRFVKEGNALFGMWTWEESTPGIVPAERDADAEHRIRAFATLGGSVRAYVHTLNTHWAYEDFRRQRAELRRQGKQPDGLALVPGVGMYSEQRRLYTANLRSLIRANSLRQLDEAALTSARVVVRTESASRGAGARDAVAQPRLEVAVVVQDSGR